MAVKILSTTQIREADAFTIKNEPIASLLLMERAAIACVQWILPMLVKDQQIRIFCGPGNNGGDGLVIARLLSAAGFNIKVYHTGSHANHTEDFLTNFDELKNQGLAGIEEISDSSSLPVIEPEDLVIDALFGSGLARPVSGIFGSIISCINNSGAITIAIDVPSGLFCDSYSDPRAGKIVQAAFTLCFQQPRLAFFFPENEDFVGEWEVLDIGLHPEFLEAVITNNNLLQENDIWPMLKARPRFAHKGTYGHGLLIAGSYGKMGAAVLASKAGLRSGAGLITAHIPAKGYQVLQTALAEAMVSIDESETHFSRLPELSAYNAIAVGPGIGMHPQTASTLKLLIQQTEIPLILDADALNILGENITWLPFLPKGSILTPHLKEFERLTYKVSDSFERNKLQTEFSVRFGVYVILKGAFTCISFPDGRCFFNPTGNPGMATGGSGDVLSGILLGLMAQGYTAAETCLLGTYLHGLAGDIAASYYGFESLIAGDIIDSLPEAFQQLAG